MSCRPPALLVLLGLVAIGACGTVQRPGAPAPSPSAAAATVSGHLSWPDCTATGPACPSVAGVPVHFADAAARSTYTAVSDDSGAYTIRLPPGSYQVIAGDADRSPYARQLTVRAGDAIVLDLPISLPTGG